MKLNERSVVHYATCSSPADKTGFLQKKGERHAAYHRRWCVLKGNLLFYFEERESREPVGLIVLEGCSVELCQSEHTDFAFALKFHSARVYKMAAESQAATEAWVKALSRASFAYMRLVVKELERQLEEVSAPKGRRAGPEGRENGVSWSRPPPVPPRRRSSSADSPASPASPSFSRLHLCYGQEVMELRLRWLQSQ